jgi:hypothetical protein
MSMGVCQALAYLARYGDNATHGQESSFTQNLSEISTGSQLLSHVNAASKLGYVEDCRDIAVGQIAGDSRLFEEALPGIGLLRRC